MGPDTESSYFLSSQSFARKRSFSAWIEGFHCSESVRCVTDEQAITDPLDVITQSVMA
jgi:hypothetical protein